jgi:hypothetical protein
VLEPGRYHDTILPGEYLYYGFELAAGQSLRVTLTHPDIDNLDVQDLGVLGMVATVHTPARTTQSGVTPPGDHRDLGFGNEEEVPLGITRAPGVAEPDDTDTREFKNAGVYYLALHPYTGTNKPPRAEIAFTFAAEVLGTAQPNVTPAATPTATPSVTRTPAPTPVPVAAAGSGPSAAAAAVGGIGGILLGVFAGIGWRGRRRQ